MQLKKNIINLPVLRNKCHTCPEVTPFCFQYNKSRIFEAVNKTSVAYFCTPQTILHVHFWKYLSWIHTIRWSSYLARPTCNVGTVTFDDLRSAKYKVKNNSTQKTKNQAILFVVDFVEFIMIVEKWQAMILIYMLNWIWKLLWRVILQGTRKISGNLQVFVPIANKIHVKVFGSNLVILCS